MNLSFSEKSLIQRAIYDVDDDLESTDVLKSVLEKLKKLKVSGTEYGTLDLSMQKENAIKYVKMCIENEVDDETFINEFIG